MRIQSVLLASLLFSSAAFAQAPPPPGPPPPPPGGYGAPPTAPYGYGSAYGPGQMPGYHRHDGGFFRAFLGFGYVNMSVEDVDLTIKGPGGIFGIAGGWAVAENLIIYAEVFDDIAFNPDVELGDFSGETEDTSAGNVGIGAGLAYYIMPANLYLSATIAASKITASSNGEDFDTNFGPSVSLMIGKEWWVSDNWGLGVAGQLFLGSMKDSDESDAKWKVISGGVVFSATYN